MLTLLLYANYEAIILYEFYVFMCLCVIYVLYLFYVRVFVINTYLLHFYFLAHDCNHILNFYISQISIYLHVFNLSVCEIT